ncbi:hypothetical protein [Microbacterium sp. NPDC096154]|uniref:hypothetical protein n=1 Tax=Microbacterium sp. NPDC096154 TaxID=3155549 RepID=UPI003327EEEA
MADVVIKYWELERLITHLERMIPELKSGDKSDAVRDAIGSPFHRHELPNAAGESESRWSYKREKLVGELESILERAKGIYESFQEFDQEAATKFESGASAPARA